MTPVNFTSNFTTAIFRQRGKMAQFCKPLARSEFFLYPQRESNPCRGREKPVSSASRRWGRFWVTDCARRTWENPTIRTPAQDSAL